MDHIKRDQELPGEFQAEYEFRLLSEGMLRTVHIVRLSSDAEACARAQAYLDACQEFDSAVIRSGTRFMRTIHCTFDIDRDRSRRPLLS